ncbi:MAG: hypothetical protein ABI591_25920 [Kofleriaceae bacterium]
MKSALLIAIGLVVAVPATALAKPRVAIVSFDGDKGGAARDVVTEAIGDDVMLVGPKQVNRTVDRLGLDTSALTDKDLKKLSKELNVDAVIQATYSKKDGTRQLHFKLFVHNKKRKGFKVEFASLKSKKFQSQLHDKMIERLDADGDGDAPVVAAKTKKGDDADDTASALTTMKKKGDDDDGPKEVKPDKKKHDDDSDGDDKPHKRVAAADDDSDSVTVRVEPHSSSTARPANHVGLRFDFGMSVQNRSLTFNSRDFPQAPKAFSQKPVPGARFGLELYPLAFGNDNLASGLGIGGMFDQTIGLNLQSTAQPGAKFAVTQRRFDVGPRFRINFGKKPTSPTLTLGVGYMQREFIVNRSALTGGNTIDLPDVKYTGFDPGIEFRIPLMERLALTFGGQAILLTSAGPIQELDSYGQAKVTGGSGTISLDILLAKHVALNLRGEATQIGYKFTGNGAMANNRDMEPSSIDIGGAADRYIGGVGTLAVLY